MEPPWPWRSLPKTLRVFAVLQFAFDTEAKSMRYDCQHENMPFNFFFLEVFVFFERLCFLWKPEPYWVFSVGINEPIPFFIASLTRIVADSFSDWPAATSLTMSKPICNAFLPMTGATLFNIGKILGNNPLKILPKPWSLCMRAP